jgi:adenylate cyclase
MTCLVYYGKHIEIVDELSIGRKNTNDLIIDENTISKKHAVIKKLENVYYIIDVGSTNGTFLNHQKIKIPTVLENGDIIQLGNVQIVFNSKDDEDDDKTLLSNDDYIVDSIVLVSDIKGYTRFSESVPISVVKKYMSNWFKQISLGVEKNGGFVDTIIGDCFYARWDKQVNKHSLERVLESVALISKVTQDLNNKLLKPYNYELGIGAAVHIGDVILGGTAYLPSGISDTVNTTFKLESLTRIYDTDFIMSDLAFSVLNMNINSQKDEVLIKGKKDKLKIQKIKFKDLEILLNA